MSVNQMCSLVRVSANQRFYCIRQFSFLPCLVMSAVFLERLLYFFTCLCRSENSLVFLIWLIVSEMELEKSRTILHIRGQSSSLATRLHTQFHYIYKIPNTCLLLNHSEMRSRKSWELVTPSSQQSSNFAPAIFKQFQRCKEKLLSLSVNRFMFFYFLLKLRIVCQLIT